MSDPLVSFIPENDKIFVKKLQKLGELTTDFRIPFNLIANDFYKSNRILFGLKSKGLYTELQPETFWAKRPHPYPIMVGKTGRLAASLLSKDAPYSDSFIGKQYMQLGTMVDYAKYHQSDRPRKRANVAARYKRLKMVPQPFEAGMENLIPQRKIVFISGGRWEKAKDSRITGRLERWLMIIDKHIEQLMQRGY